MKIFISIFMALLMGAHFVFGGYVLWVGIDDDATLYDGYSTTRFVTWVTSAEIRGNAGGRIRIENTPLAAGFEDPNQVEDPSLIPAGQTTPSIVWEVDYDGEHWGPYSDFYLEVVDINGEPTGSYADWQPIKIPDNVNPNQHVEVYYDIGYWDENEEFVTVATAMGYLDNLYNGDSTGKHIYETGSIVPPIEVPWRPLEFRYGTVIPEPSTSALALLGTALLFFKRKSK